VSKDPVEVPGPNMRVIGDLVVEGGNPGTGLGLDCFGSEVGGTSDELMPGRIEFPVFGNQAVDNSEPEK
jgi:hypothetical protein